MSCACWRCLPGELPVDRGQEYPLDQVSVVLPVVLLVVLLAVALVVPVLAWARGWP